MIASLPVNAFVLSRDLLVTRAPSCRKYKCCAGIRTPALKDPKSLVWRRSAVNFSDHSFNLGAKSRPMFILCAEVR
jgi:hypothetical protein